MLKKCVMLAALATVLAPGAASADWLLTPNLGMSFGGTASGREHITYGFSVGWMGAGVLGWEADFAYTPEFFEADDDDIDLIENSNVTTFMVNAILGVPVGGTTGGGFRPYFSGGIGLMQTNVTEAVTLFKVDNSEFGINLGAGAMAFASDHVGFRGDVRYFRQLSDPDEDNEFDIALGDLDYWRATAGITFRW
jgi:opacity protein-like surface antigen